VVAYGDKKKFVSALVTLDPEAMADWAAQNGMEQASIEQLSGHPEVVALIRDEVEERNGQLASFESVRKFHILPRDLTIEAGEMTPSLKIKRRVVVERYNTELEALYAD
jgi:long-chain acyl-CoA synthetase